MMTMSSLFRSEADRASVGPRGESRWPRRWGRVGGVVHCPETSLAAALSLFKGAAETVRLGAGFDNVRPIRDAIQQRFAQARVGNDLGPLRKRQVRRQ